MKVFISWSGERSKVIAESLREWLRIVVPQCEPWLSKDDIRKGTRWSAELAAILEQTQFGIICLTPENVDRPWILFEAGALSKSLTDTYVCPFLFELEPPIVGPLEQFQAVVFEKKDLKVLARNVNEAHRDTALKDDVLDRLFENAWPELEARLLSIPPLSPSEQRKSMTEEMVREILARIRADQREAETRESEYYKARDSLMSAMLKLFQLGVQNKGTLPADIAKDFEDWNVNTQAFLRKEDFSTCPDCLGTGWVVSKEDVCAKRCEHPLLTNTEDLPLP